MEFLGTTIKQQNARKRKCYFYKHIAFRPISMPIADPEIGEKL